MYLCNRAIISFNDITDRFKVTYIVFLKSATTILKYWLSFLTLSERSSSSSRFLIHFIHVICNDFFVRLQLFSIFSCWGLNLDPCGLWTNYLLFMIRLLYCLNFWIGIQYFIKSVTPYRNKLFKLFLAYWLHIMNLKK